MEIAFFTLSRYNSVTIYKRGHPPFAARAFYRFPDMKHRFLLVGDTFWGEERSTAELAANLALVDYPQLPLSFSIHSSARNTLDHLFQTCSRDIIGRQAGTSLLCVGWLDLLSGDSIEHVQAGLERLIHEIRHNCQTVVFLCTLPSLQFSAESVIGKKVRSLNAILRALGKSDIVHVVDLDRHFQEYQAKQLVRGDLIRNLFTDEGTLGELGQMLAARSVLQALPLA